MAETALLLPRPAHIRRRPSLRTMLSKKLQNSPGASSISLNPDPPTAPGPTEEAGATENTDMHDGLRPTIPTRCNEYASPQLTQTTQTKPTVTDAHNHTHPMVPLDGCVVAEKAWVFINDNDFKLQGALQGIGYEGVYMVQAGFDEDVFRSRKGLLQQVTIFLGSNISAVCAERVAAVLHPFPVQIHTPKVTHTHQPPNSGLREIWDLAMERNTATVDIGHGTSVLSRSNVGDDQPNIAGPSSGARGDKLGGDLEGRDMGKEKEKGRGEGQARQGERGSQNGTRGSHTYHTCKFGVAFQSDLIVHWAEAAQRSTEYTITAQVTAEVEDNPDKKSPACENWGNEPWLRAKFDTLVAKAKTDTPGEPGASLDFHAGTAQVKITTGGMTSWCLERSPQQTDVPVKVTDPDAKGWLKGIIGRALGFGLDGSMSRNSTNERSDDKWNVSRELTQDWEHTSSEALWEYDYNDQFHLPQAENYFSPLPNVLLSLYRDMVTTPKIGFEAIIHFRRSVASKKVCQNIANSEHVTLPAYATFVQKAGVLLDLPEQTDGQWGASVNANDALQESEIGTEKSLITEATTPLENGSHKSRSKLTFTRALEGRVHPVEIPAGENICTGLWSWVKYWLCCEAATQ